MKEYPILFSTEMVKAILDGRKTQTRRVIKLKEYDRSIWDSCVPHNKGRDGFLGEPYLKVPYDPIVDNAGNRITCPYGQVGQRLWVRETWATQKSIDKFSPSYIGDAGTVPLWYKAGDNGSSLIDRGKWRSSRFMPRWASRIDLEITEVRVERLHLMTEEDSIREGFSENINDFALVWDSLNAKRGYGWDVNPWCWCISFKELPDAK